MPGSSTIRNNDHRLNSRGQAAVELTVFGFLIVVALSVLTMYGQQFEMQQQAKMESFRRAIKLAYDKNSSVAYTLKKDTRFIDIMGAYGKGQATSVAGSASVMWQKGMAGYEKKGKDSSYAYYAVNDQMLGTEAEGVGRFEKEVYGFDGSRRKVKVPVSIWKEEIKREESYHGDMVKKEEKSEYALDGDGKKVLKKPGAITSERTGELKDQLSTKVITRKDTAVDRDPWRKNSPFGPAPKYTTLDTHSVKQGATLVGVPSGPDRGVPKVDEGQLKYPDMPLNGGDPNRVVYTTPAAAANGGAGTTIVRKRTWVTDILSD